MWPATAGKELAEEKVSALERFAFFVLRFDDFPARGTVSQIKAKRLSV